MEISIDPNNIISCYESVLKHQQELLKQAVKKWKEGYPADYKKRIIDHFERNTKHWFYKWFVTDNDFLFLEELKAIDDLELLYKRPEYRTEYYLQGWDKNRQQDWADESYEKIVTPVENDISLIAKIKDAAIHAQNSDTLIKLSNREIELFSKHITYEPYR